MRWQGRRQSGNVVDRRGVGRVGFTGGGMGLLALAALWWFLGGNPLALLSTSVPSTQVQPGSSSTEDTAAEFIRVVLADTEDVWNSRFAAMGRSYEEPTLVMFTQSVDSACGWASSATGPFYCPADQDIYLDLGFFGELSRRYHAPGDFAAAYVVAHEVGHHVQRLLGTMEEVERLQYGATDAERNQLSVRLELQADF